MELEGASSLRLAIVASHPIQYQAPLFRALAEKVDLHVFFAHSQTAIAQAEAGFGVAFDWDCDLTSGYSHTFLKNRARRPNASRILGCDTPEVGKWIRSGGYDGVLVMGWQLKTYWQAVFACRASGVPVMVRGDSQLATPRSPLLRAAKRLIYPGALNMFSAALHVGERSRAYFAAYGVPHERIFFAPHSVDQDWFRRRATAEAGAGLRAKLGVRPGERLLLFAGKLVDFKRPLDVVRAAARLASQGHDVGVLVAGSGSLAEAMVAEAAAADVRLYMAGFLNQSEMPAAYAAADVLVLPSSGRETWGLVALEAMVCSKPIVVSDEVGCAPDLADGRGGRSFSFGDIDHLAIQAAAALGAPPCRIPFDEVSRRFSTARCADGILEALSFCATPSK